MVDFFNSLSLVGFLGVLLWIAFILSIFIKPHWYVDYYRRFPKVNAFEEYIYDLPRQIGFMVVRFVLICFIVFVIGRLITLIGADI